MLTLLRISDFALIDSLEIELGPGLTVITGETGAGKSILVEAINLLRGGRARAEVIRAGGEQAQVEALWALPADDPETRAAGDGDAELLVRRVIARSGRGRNYVDGQLVTLAELAARVGGLIDITSQHDQQSLMDAESQRAILDAYAENGPLLARMAAAHAALAQAREALGALRADARTRGQREDFLRFQLAELDSAALRPGEEEALRAERERMRAAERLGAAVARGEELLYGAEDAAAARIAAVLRELEPLAGIEPRFVSLCERLHEARALVEDVARELGRQGEPSGDPRRLEEIEERLYLLARLARKHGGSIEGALAERERIAAELAALHNLDDALAEREAAVRDALRAARAVAAELTRRRQAAAAALGPAMDATLAELGLAGARLSLRVVPRAGAGEPRPTLPDGAFDAEEQSALEPGPRGADEVRFEFAANPGEPGGPLSRVASGGELSRVMLACKRALAHADRALTYVFDEVDTGVGGGVAEAIGRKLKQVAARRQVLVVTHLPQIAALADHHLLVRKQVRDGRTVVQVRPLDAAARKAELARMLGGHPPSDEAVAHAGQLLRSATQAATPPRRARGPAARGTREKLPGS